MFTKEKIHQINIAFEYKSEDINAVLHTTFNLFNPYVTIIVPGIFGDRGDSRAMFTRIAHDLSLSGISVLRFDFCGGGSNFGNYYENDFEMFIDQLDVITSQLLNSFGFLKKVIYIAFSEGLKFSLFTAAKRKDVASIISCNGLCVEESFVDKIKRPKIKNGLMVYDSDFGSWINWNIVEHYKDYFIDNCDFNKAIDFLGIYSTDDIYSQNSRNYWEENEWPIFMIPDADHLFTKELWVEQLIEIINNWHKKKIFGVPDKGNEFYLNTGKNMTCMKLVENERAQYCILFLHGLFQNKSGPGFLFTQLADILREKCSICMFDFPACGDSDGKSEDLDYEEMEYTLIRVVNFVKQKYPNMRLVGIASGCSNYLIYKNRELFYESIMLFPEKSKIWDRLDEKDRMLQQMDTCSIYECFEWAEDECCILGNVRNRSKGMCLSTKFLKQLSEFSPMQMLKNFDGYVFTNNQEYCMGEKSFFLNDKQGLAMSASIRDELINYVIDCIDRLDRKGVKIDKCNYSSI